MPSNKGFEQVSKSPRKKGKFTSPNNEPLGKPIGVRLPLSVESWLDEEAEKQGTSKSILIRQLLTKTKFYQTQSSV